MLIAYDLEHAGDSYNMYNPQTGRNHINKGIKWLSTMYFKNVRLHNTEDLIKLKAGKSDKHNSEALNDVSDVENKFK